MKTRSAKNKGLRLQKWVAEKISDLTGIKIVEDGDIQSRQASQSGADVIIRGKATDLWPFGGPECKNVERLNLYKSIDQAKQYESKGKPWILFHKKNNNKPIVIMDAEEFFKFLERYIKDGCKYHEMGNK